MACSKGGGSIAEGACPYHYDEQMLLTDEEMRALGIQRLAHPIIARLDIASSTHWGEEEFFVIKSSAVFDEQEGEKFYVQRVCHQQATRSFLPKSLLTFEEKSEFSLASIREEHGIAIPTPMPTTFFYTTSSLKCYARSIFRVRVDTEGKVCTLFHYTGATLGDFGETFSTLPCLAEYKAVQLTEKEWESLQFVRFSALKKDDWAAIETKKITLAGREKDCEISILPSEWEEGYSERLFCTLFDGLRFIVNRKKFFVYTLPVPCFINGGEVEVKDIKQLSLGEGRVGARCSKLTAYADYTFALRFSHDQKMYVQIKRKRGAEEACAAPFSPDRFPEGEWVSLKLCDWLQLNFTFISKGYYQKEGDYFEVEDDDPSSISVKRLKSGERPPQKSHLPRRSRALT